jgi:hypothetical protein
MSNVVITETSREDQKQRSREADERALATGEKTREDLWRENSFIPPGKMRVDYKRIRTSG